MLNGAIRRPGGSTKAFVYALLVHGLLVALLIFGVRWQTRPAAVDPKIVQATVVQDPEIKKEVERLKQENERTAALEAQRAKEALQEAQRQRQAEVDKKKQQMLEKQALEKQALEKQQAAELKQKTEEKKKLEQKKLAEAELKRQATEQQKKDSEQRRQQAEAALKEQLAAEEQDRTQAQAAAAAASQRGEIARFEAIIRQKVERSWTRPANAREGLECVVQVRLIAGGEVLQAAVVRSSGNPLFDRSAVNAIYKASPLPVPDDKSMFDHFREFDFKFRPEG